MARIVVHLHGIAKEPSLRDLISNYEERLLGRGINIKVHSEKLTDIQYEEALLALNGNLLLLDESGISEDSIAFSKRISATRLASQVTNMAIGPTDGFSPAVKSSAQGLISLSTLTMPHELAAVVLLEQLYRATEISKGSPYHRDAKGPQA